MGESGVGKSTLLNLIAGLDRPDAGTIALDGDRADHARRRRADRRCAATAMGFVFQAFHVLPYLTVAQNVALPLSLVGAEGAASLRVGSRMLAAVGLAERAESLPRELSGGELQRVAIARALVHDRGSCSPTSRPAISIPTARDQVLALLRDQVKARGAAGILVTHSRAAAQTADRVLRARRATGSVSWHRAWRDGSPSRAGPAQLPLLRGSLAQNRGASRWRCSRSRWASRSGLRCS